MALANFFDRAATAASQVLQGFDLATFRARLELQSVAIAFDSTAAASTEGRVTIDMAVNLLVRLYPTIGIVPLDRAARQHLRRLEELARSINPSIRFIKRPRNDSPLLVVGRTAASTGARRIFTGSNGWISYLSCTEPVGSGETGNPFGAAAAACFGVANIFRLTFADQLPGGGPDDAISFSVLTHEQGSERPVNPELLDVELSGSCVAGLGAVGNAFAWTLGRLPVLRGSLDLVDHEAVELSNLQRYVLTDQHSINRSKVELAAAYLTREGFEPRPHPVKWGGYLAERGDHNVERLIVAVDSAADRIAMQASLPRWICNAWTQTHDLGISRHNFLSDNACLMCLYLPDGKTLDEDEIVATSFGMPEAKKELIRPMLHHNAPMTEDLLTKIGTALNINTAELQVFVGKPIREFYVEAFCGGAIFKMSNGGQPTQALVPMAFQSALAGILLAAETVAHASGLRSEPRPTVTTINLLRPLTPYVSFPRKKDPHGHCICQDLDYLAVYREKWIASTQSLQ